MTTNAKLLQDTCLLAGKIMISSGSETYRVEDTVQHIARSAGVDDEIVFTLPTGIFVSNQHNQAMQQRAIFDRVTNLRKVHEVNRLSRQFAAHRLTLEELHSRLEEVDHEVHRYPLIFQLLAVAVISAMMIPICIPGYHVSTMLCAAVAGCTGYVVNSTVNRVLRISFFSQLLATFVIGLIAQEALALHLVPSAGNVVIGAVMALVPGVAITNAFRDLLAGHLLTSVAHGLEALFCAAALGTGIALAFRFF